MIQQFHSWVHMQKITAMWMDLEVLRLVKQAREKHGPKGYMHPNVHYNNAVHKSQDIEATEMSIDRGKDKEYMVCIQDGMLFSY